MIAAGGLPAEKRSVFLERVAARLRLRGPHFTDADLGAAIQAALTGLTNRRPTQRGNQMVAGADSKHAPLHPTHLHEQMSVTQVVQLLEALHFDKHEEARVMIDPGVQAFLIRATKAAAADHLDAKVRQVWRSIRPAR